MKNLIALLVMSTLLLVSGCNEPLNAKPHETHEGHNSHKTAQSLKPTSDKVSSTTSYQEGVHYVKVEGIVSEKDEVREYFSFYCPHCYQFEGFIDILKKELPKDIALEKNHVDFLRMASQKMQQLLTQALVVGQELNMEAEASAAIFKYIHVSNATPTSMKDIRNIFILIGVDADKFDALINSENVIAKAKTMKANQDALAKTEGITGVPAVIVNGKYRIVNSGLDKENFKEDYLNLVSYLVSLK
ncbi:thiol:disulfide interchange protein DsbA/DsbL [Thalassotalea profundi]|uniref:Thiol:disulfide interchange protein DsbA n=1 Tax=Thalassotalea profundi TaxID=2036687 RepID=A0ABQ3IR53_9GAMM|nr:thiol:disulfide interchange protein DsbA/DsbL [Thalassotalea profundi]GHE88492.1 thiol:disulfide interchange protein [Thalassotalea profundi]